MPMCSRAPSVCPFAYTGLRTSVRSPSLSAVRRSSCLFTYAAGALRGRHPRHPSPVRISLFALFQHHVLLHSHVRW